MTRRIPIVKHKKHENMSKSYDEKFEEFIIELRHEISSVAKINKSILPEKEMISLIVSKLYDNFDNINKSQINIDDIVKDIISNIKKSLNNKKEKQEIKTLIKKISKAISNKKQNIKKSKTEDIRIRQRNPKIFKKSTMKTISLSKSMGIKAVIGNLPYDNKIRVQTLIFNRDPEIGKSWNLKEAKEWVKDNRERIKISIGVKELLQKTGE